MNVKYHPADLVQVNFKALKDAQTILVYIQETVLEKVIIHQGINQFNKHMDLNEAVGDWKNIASQKIWKTFKKHFTTVVIKNQKCSGTLRETEISNQV